MNRNKKIIVLWNYPKRLCEVFALLNSNNLEDILITTSYIDSQAYQEVVEDGHPILVVTATDIVRILRMNSITSENIDVYLSSIDSKRKEWEQNK